MGWKRFVRFQFLTLSRMPGGIQSISRGFACGAAVSFTPFVGLHFLIAGISAKIFRGNVIAALIGTAVGNPWTFPFIWTLVYSTGRKIFYLNQPGDLLQAELRWDTLFTHFFDIFLPMLIGCLPYLLIVWLIAYYICQKSLILVQKKERAE